MLVSTAATVTSVAFGQSPGTDLTQSGDTWAVAAPAHTCGVVDLTVTLTRFGVTTTQTLTDAYTFGTAPVVTTDPFFGTLTAGQQEASLTAAATGDTTPTVQRQQRTSTGRADIPDATAATLTTTTSTTTDYRAVFTNCLGTATTQTATLTLTTTDGSTSATGPTPADPTSGTGSTPTVTTTPDTLPSAGTAADQTSDSNQDDLASTGASGSTHLAVTATILLLTGAAALITTRRRTTRRPDPTTTAPGVSPAPSRERAWCRRRAWSGDGRGAGG